MPADLRIHAGLGKNTLFLASALSVKKRKIFSQPIHPLTDGGDPLVNWGELCVVVGAVGGEKARVMRAG